MIVSNLNRGRATLECTFMSIASRHYREGCTYFSHRLREILSFEFISEQYFQGYPAYIRLSLFPSKEHRLQEFNCGSYATFIAEIKHAS